jgi:hypothetical protein
MPRHSAFLDVNRDAGTEKIFHRLHDGDWVVETRQDVRPILDFNKWSQNHNHGYSVDRSIRHVASIPLIIIEKWRNELGVDYWNPDHQDKVDALLNDPEWRWLRSTRATL